MAKSKHDLVWDRIARKLRHRSWNLPIVVIPHGGWAPRDMSLANSDNRLHRAIRRFLIETEGARCSACGFIPTKSSQLEAHEVYRLDERKRIMTFISYRLLCKDCHYLTHQGYWAMLGYADRAYAGHLDSYSEKSKRLTMHFCKVNQCTVEEAYVYSCIAPTFRSSEKRWYYGKKWHRGKRWQTDWSALAQYQGKLGSNNATLDKMLADLHIKKSVTRH